MCRFQRQEDTFLYQWKYRVWPEAVASSGVFMNIAVGADSLFIFGY